MKKYTSFFQKFGVLTKPYVLCKVMINKTITKSIKINNYDFINMKKITYSLWAIVLMAIVSIQAIVEDKGYAIQFDIKNYTNNQMIVAHHFGSNQYITDTLIKDKSGQFVAKGDKELAPGMYIAFFPSIKKSFEFLVNKGEQHFKLTTDTQNFIGNMSVKGSPENKMFFNYLNYLGKQRNDRTGISKLLEQLKKDKATNENKIKELENKIKVYSRNYQD